jgi:internalin A
MSASQKAAIAVPLYLTLMLFCAARSIAGGESSDSTTQTVAGRALPAPWDIVDDPFGHAPSTRCLCAYAEPNEDELDAALNDPEVQRLIKAHLLVSIKVPSLAKLTDAGLTQLGNIQGLSGLSLDADRKSTLDPGFARLKRMDWLESLEIIGDELSDSDMESLNGFTRLRILKLGTAVKITGSGLAFLKASRKLETLELNANRLNDEHLDNLKQWPNLSTLTLGEPWGLRESFQVSHSFSANPSWLWVQKGPGPIIDRGMQNLQHVPNLRRLELNGINISDTGLKPIRGLPRLENLRLSALKVGEAGLANLEALTKLRSLEIRDMPTPGGTLGRLKAMPQLAELKLVRTDITNSEASQLVGLESMRWLCITRSGELRSDDDVVLSDGAVLAAVLKSMPNIVEIDIIDYPGIGDTALQGIAALKSLKRLKLSGTTVTNAGLRQIAAITALNELEISHSVRSFFDVSRNVVLDRSPIGDNGMKYLKGLTKLRVLNLDDTDITDNGLEELRGLVELRQIYLPGDITDMGIKHLGNMRNLEVIRMPGRKITAKSVLFLHDHCPKLKTAAFPGKNYIVDGELQLGEYSGNQYWETHSVVYAELAAMTMSGSSQFPKYVFELRPKLTLSGPFDTGDIPNVSPSFSSDKPDAKSKLSTLGPNVLVVLVQKDDSYYVAPGRPAFMPGDHAAICNVKDSDDPKVKETLRVIQTLRYGVGEGKSTDEPGKQ